LELLLPAFLTNSLNLSLLTKLSHLSASNGTDTTVPVLDRASTLTTNSKCADQL
jgi:hypothetical protein